MRAENARLGVETTMKNDLTARSATYPRSRSSNDQRQSARADREWLEKCQQGGPRMGSSSEWLEKCQQGGPRMGGSSRQQMLRASFAPFDPSRTSAVNFFLMHHSHSTLWQGSAVGLRGSL